MKELDFLNNLSEYEKNSYIDIVGKKELELLLEDIRKNGDRFKIGNYLFSKIYSLKEYQGDILYLLNNGYIRVDRLKPEIVLDILKTQSWGFDFVYDNIECFANSPFGYYEHNAISKLVGCIKDDKEKYNKLLNKVLDSDDQVLKDKFIISSLIRNVIEDESSILKALTKESDIPEYMMMTKKENLKEILFKNYLAFFKASKNKKLELLKYFEDNNIDIEDLKEYKKLSELYKKYECDIVDEIISSFIDKNDYSFLLETLGDKEIEYLDRGTTTVVYKVGDKVIKLSGSKHSDTSDEINSFLIAPTTTHRVNQKDKNYIIEIQNYLEKKHNNTTMTNEDIEMFTEEFSKQGFVVTDPNCISKKTDNFGFLKDYHEANISGLNSHEELPEWFKNRPVVLYDIDLIYKKDDENKKYMRHITL